MEKVFKVIIITLFFIFSKVYAQETSLTQAQSIKIEIEKLLLKNLKSNTPNFSEIDDITQEAQKYILIKKKECEGEYSVQKSSSEEFGEVFLVKLSDNEKKLCMQELIYFRIKYIKDLYLIKEKIAKQDFDERIKNLRVQSQKLVKELTDHLKK